MSFLNLFSKDLNLKSSALNFKYFEIISSVTDIICFIYNIDNRLPIENLFLTKEQMKLSF